MRQVILVRHGAHAEVGHVLSGRSEIPLSARGQAEAAALVDALAATAIASLHTSPRARARQTLAPLAARTDLPVQVADALDEIDFGAFTGHSFASLDGDPAWLRWNAARGTARCPGGETMAQASDRALGYLAALPSEAFPALCVTHCDIIRALVVSQLGLGFDRMFGLGCDPASRTTLDLTAGATQLIALNERTWPGRAG